MTPFVFYSSYLIFSLCLSAFCFHIEAVKEEDRCMVVTNVSHDYLCVEKEKQREKRGGEKKKRTTTLLSNGRDVILYGTISVRWRTQGGVFYDLLWVEGLIWKKYANGVSNKHSGIMNIQ